MIASGNVTNFDLASAYNIRAIAYEHQGQHDLAIQDYTAGLRLFPKDPTLLSNRGKLYGNLRQFDLALADLDLAIEMMQGMSDASDHASILDERGDVYDAMGRYPEAIGDYQAAHGLDYFFAIFPSL